MRIENLIIYGVYKLQTPSYQMYVYIFGGRMTWEAIMTHIRDPLKLRNLKIFNFIYLCLYLLRIYYNFLYTKTRKL
jgi:hypothetical protein